MRWRLGLMSLLFLACKASPEVEWPTPGAEIVLEYGCVAGRPNRPGAPVARPPLVAPLADVLSLFSLLVEERRCRLVLSSGA
jgi:hypothetical protein